MHFVVLTRDRLDSAAERRTALAAHREYVDKHARQIVVSGPLLDDDGETRTGQLFLLDVADRESALRFVADDPFTQSGIFSEVEVHEFKLVLLNGQRT